MLSATQNSNSSIVYTSGRGYEANVLSNTAEIITINDIRAAATRIAPFIKRTPTLIDTYLSSRFGCSMYLKHELLQRTAAFKVRGAFNKLLTLTDEQKAKGVVAVSAGNHAQAVAYAAKALGMKALILMPADTPENYIEKTRGYDAEIELHPDLSDAFDAARGYERAGKIFVHPFDDRDVVAGQGTIGLEILDEVPQVTDIVVSIGGGGLAGGVAAAVKSVRPNVRIWGVETYGAHSMSMALAADRVIDLPEITSIARTLGAPRVGELNLALAKKYISAVTVVSDEEAVNEMFCLLDKAKVLTEPATSCTLAAAERLRDNFGQDSHVVLILCGGNIALNDLFDLRANGIKHQK